jgi:Glycosyltransferase family 87
VLLPFCLPIHGNFQQGQLTFPLLLLITSAWSLDRAGRPGTAGLMIGTAAAVKLFPAYMAVYFAARGRWRAVCTAAASFATINLATAALLGWQAYADYVLIVLPSLEKFQSYAFNLSFSGFLHKLFDPASERGWIAPLCYSPAAARWGTLVADLLATAMVARAAWRARTRDERDLAFGLATAAMLLVSPITWDYSLPLLLLPFAILTRAAMASRWLPVPLVPVLIIFGLPQKNVMKMILAGQEARVATPGFMLGLPSLSFYALLATFVMLVVLTSRRPGPESP